MQNILLLFALTSPAFNNGSPIPSYYTCEGDNTSPPLQWTTPPANTQSFSLIMDDPDASDLHNPIKTRTHWIVYNIPVNISSLAESQKTNSLNIREGIDDDGHQGYSGPCPPTIIGSHRYRFNLYALDIPYLNLVMPDRLMIEQAMKGHIIAQTTLIGTYHKSA